MAKRKRLSPAQTDYLASQTAAPETKSRLGSPQLTTPAPIAQVAGEAATSAALQEVAGEMARARAEGRLIQTLQTAEIDETYLVRDRLVAQDDELQALMASIQARGQQTPIEVVPLEGGRYGLISGWRRLTALKRLAAETGEDRFTFVKALMRRPESAADAYVAMVEENEIRVGLSYYERARVAAKAVEQGVFETEKAALLSLYAAASRAKRSKIRSFLSLYHAADDVLQFPAAIGERQGLALARAVEEGAEDLRAALTAADAADMEAEQAALKAYLAEAAPEAEPEPEDEAEATSPSPKAKTPRTPKVEGDFSTEGKYLNRLRDGVFMAWDEKAVVLTGPAVTSDFRLLLAEWVMKSGRK